MTSIAWLLGAGSFGAMEGYDLLAEKKFEVAREGIPKFILVYSQLQTDEDASKDMTERVFPVAEKSPTQYGGKMVREPYERFVSERQGPLARRYVLLGLVPPVVVLLLGLALSWVRHGFQAKPPA